MPSSPAVQIMAEVQAAICCERTKPTVRVVANTDLDRISSGAPLSVHLWAMDMDDQPVRFSRAELELTWDGVAVPFGWLRGQSEYSWQIPPDRDEGEHKIVVRLNGSECTLLSITVTVAYRTQMILAMSIAGVAIVTLAGMMAYQIRAHQEQVKRFVESFLKHEGVLAVKIGWDAWVRPNLPAFAVRCAPRATFASLHRCLQDIGGDGAQTTSCRLRQLGLLRVLCVCAHRRLCDCPVLQSSATFNSHSLGAATLTYSLR